MRAQLVCATVLLGAVASPQLAAMAQDGAPLLFVNRRSPDGASRPFIGIDNDRAGRAVAAFFLSRGIAVRGVIHGRLASSATAGRVAAFRDALARGGQVLADSAVATLDVADHMAIGYRCAASLLGGRQSGRCGLFCSSDLIAYGAHRAITEAGLRVPRDVALIGFDDNPLNDWLAPWLTSVRVPYDAFGDAVIKALYAIWSGAGMETVLLDHRLVVREGAVSK